jgi:signal peptidase
MLSFLRHCLNVMLLLIVTAALAWLIWRPAGTHIFSVQSGSMSPVINRGDLTFDIKPTTIQAGDIITYQSQVHPRQQVTHRIISVDTKSQTVITKGDSLSMPDPIIPASAVTGKVYKVIPKAGYAYDWVRKPLGLVMMVYLPALLIIIVELWTLAGQLNYRQYSLLKTP